MMRWLSPTALTQQHLRLIAQSITGASSFDQLSGAALLQDIHAGTAHVFTLGAEGIIILQCVRGWDGSQRLRIVAFAGSYSIFYRREIAVQLRRIAADWRCDTIETTAYDGRLARAIQRIGGKVESINLTLSVKG